MATLEAAVARAGPQRLVLAREWLRGPRSLGRRLPFLAERCSFWAQVWSWRQRLTRCWPPSSSSRMALCTLVHGAPCCESGRCCCRFGAAGARPTRHAPRHRPARSGKSVRLCSKYWPHHLGSSLPLAAPVGTRWASTLQWHRKGMVGCSNRTCVWWIRALPQAGPPPLHAASTSAMRNTTTSAPSSAFRLQARATNLRCVHMFGRCCC
mmetsp:Transcript_8574/g.22594  ORF Transcript_8574/g.22594 Transcript_8574/m.22594 type:complete len:209 (+) Transcript_8574:715-1341(+)